MTREYTEIDDTPQLSGQFDVVSKQIIRNDPDECIQFYLGTSDAHVIKVLETEQPVVKWYRADSFIHANVKGEEAIVHLEFQTHDSKEIPMPYRVAGYAGLGIRMYQLPIYSHVIYLHPNAGLNDPGEYVQNISGYEITIKYKVIRLCEIEGQGVLDARLKGLIPFAPLMKPPTEMEPEQWLRECVRVADSIPMDEPDKPDFLSNMAILGGIILDYETIRKIISEETMYASSVIQHWTEQGIKKGLEQGREEGLEQGREEGLEQGERKGVLESLIDFLEVHFSHDEVQHIKPILENIEELQQLKQIRHQALQVSSIDEFRSILSSNGN